MPNWTYNEIRIKGDKNTIASIKEFVKSEESEFDFNKIIPMPDSLNIESGSRTDRAILVYLSDKLTTKPNKREDKWQMAYNLVSNPFREDWVLELYDRLVNDPPKDIDQLYEDGKTYVDNYQKYGAVTWYEWRCANWSTKWNACRVSMTDSHEEEVEYFFDTAWCCPYLVISELSQIYPNVKIEHQYRNEDGYETIFTDIYLNGEIIEERSEIDKEYLKEIEEYLSTN